MDDENLIFRVGGDLIGFNYDDLSLREAIAIAHDVAGDHKFITFDASLNDSYIDPDTR